MSKASALYVLHEAASGYALFDVVELDEVASLTPELQAAIADADAFKRICKLTTRLHGAASLELAAHLSKLAAVQDSAGKEIESKLSWNRALYIFEINRAPSPNPESASSAKNRSKRRKAIRREIVQMGGKEVDKVDSGKETKGGKGVASTMSAKTLAPNRTAAARAKASASQPPSSQRGMNVEPRKKQPKPIALQVLYKIPHWSMQSADAAVINTTHIHVDQLTPRTRYR